MVKKESLSRSSFLRDHLGDGDVNNWEIQFKAKTSKPYMTRSHEGHRENSNQVKKKCCCEMKLSMNVSDKLKRD